jgi:hypothetical protein
MEITSTPAIFMVSEPEMEVFYIIETFRKTFISLGPNSWSPFFVFFQDPFNKTAICQSAVVGSFDEMLSAISEISHLSSSLSSYSNILALDFSSEPLEIYYNNDFYISNSYLKILFYNRSNLIAINAPYIIINNEPIFVDSSFTIEEEVSVDEDLSAILSILHTHSHSNESQHSVHHVLSYLTAKGHHPLIFNPNYKVYPYFNYGNQDEYLENLSILSSS